MAEDFQNLMLTVLIRDETPMRYMQEPIRLRTVHVLLSAEQLKQIELKDDNEAISHAFLEAVAEQEQGNG